MVCAGQPHLAAKLCAEGHEAGALRAYALPDPATPPQPGAALGNALDLRQAAGDGCLRFVLWLGVVRS